MRRREISGGFRVVVLVAILSSPGAPPPEAQTITFESGIPGAAPCLEVTDQFEDTLGVVFSQRDRSSGEAADGPYLARVGGEFDAFVAADRTFNLCNQPFATENDMPAFGEPVGCWFLTTSCTQGERDKFIMEITYLGEGVREASGQLIDVDSAFSRREEFTIRAYDVPGGTPIDTTVVSYLDPDAGDGLLSTWTVEAPEGEENITRIEIEYTGTDSGEVGIAFDNFALATSPPDLCVSGDVVECVGYRAEADTTFVRYRVKNVSGSDAEHVTLSALSGFEYVSTDYAAIGWEDDEVVEGTLGLVGAEPGDGVCVLVTLYGDLFQGCCAEPFCFDLPAACPPLP